MNIRNLRFSRALLGLYPASFRSEFGTEWMQVIEWRAEQYSRQSFGLLKFAAVIARDAIISLPIAHARTFFGSKKQSSQSANPAGTTGGGDQPPQRSSGGRRLESLLADIKFSVRGLVRTPVFTVAAVMSLALGIGGNTAIFSVVNAVLLKPLPYHEPENLAIIWNEFPQAGLSRLPMSGVEIAALRERDDVFEDVGGVWATSRTVLSEDRSSQASTGLVTINFFSVLGVGLNLGSGFSSEPQSGTGRQVIISHEFWSQHYGTDPRVLGQLLNIGGREHQVVGVLPAGLKFFFPTDAGIPERLELYTPLPTDLTVLPVAQHFLRVVARLNPGRTVAQAQEAAIRASEEVKQAYTELADTGDRFTVVPLKADSVRAIRPVLLVLLAAVSLVLLLAAVNVASLVLARSSTRRSEFAVRACIGASRKRLLQQLLTESALLGIIGSVTGISLGTLAVNTLWTARPPGLSRIDEIGLDPTVLTFSVLATLLATVLFGLAPLSQLRHASPAGALRSHGSMDRRAQNLRRAMIVSEIGLALVLLIGAGLLGKTLAGLQQAQVGFDPDNKLTLKIPLSSSRFPTAEQKTDLSRQISQTLSGLPGVLSVGASSHVPFIGWANWGDIAAPEGTDEANRSAFQFDHRSITPGYLETIGASLIDGRFFSEVDLEGTEPVVIIDETLARRAFGTDNPIGKRIQATRYAGAGEFEPTWAIVVGVVGDIRDRSPEVPSGGQIFWPFSQSARWELTYVVHTAGNPTAIVSAARDAVQQIPGELAPSDFVPIRDYLDATTAGARFTTLLATLFSTMALILAMLGLYGVINYTTTQRAREFGLRIALGARSVDILRDVLGDGLKTTAAGIALGIGIALVSMRFIASLLFGVSPTDISTFMAVSAVFLLVSLGASYIPARKAIRIDPREVLKAE